VQRALCTSRPHGVGMRFIAPQAAFGFSPKEGVGLQAASGKARLSGEVGIAWEAHSSRLQRSAAPTTLRVSPSVRPKTGSGIRRQPRAATPIRLHSIGPTASARIDKGASSSESARTALSLLSKRGSIVLMLPVRSQSLGCRGVHEDALALYRSHYSAFHPASLAALSLMVHADACLASPGQAERPPIGATASTGYT
jgi:hypothetical protein